MRCGAAVKVREAELEQNERTINTMRAEVLQAQAQYERAEESLKYASIRSPLNGVVLSRELEVGDAVSSILQLGSNATLIMTLGDVQELYVKGKVDETDIGMVKVGQPVRVTRGRLQKPGVSRQGFSHRADGGREGQRDAFRGARVDHERPRPAESCHERQCRDRARGASRRAHHPGKRADLQREAGDLRRGAGPLRPGRAGARCRSKPG